MLRNAFAATIVAALALATGVLSACQPNAVPGRGCAPEGDFGIGSDADGVNTYRCGNGRWEWSMTTQRAGELLKQALDAKAAADAAAATTTTTAAPETTTTTTTTPPAPVVPAGIVGCYAASIGDAKVVHDPSFPDWVYLAGYYASTDGSCTGWDGNADLVVQASSDAEATARCAEFTAPDPSMSGGLWWESNPALANVYICVNA